MVPGNSLLSERIAWLALMPPTALTAATSVASTPYFSVQATPGNLFQRYFAAVQLAGTSNTNAVSIALYKASDTSGTGSATVSVQTYSGTNVSITTNTASILCYSLDINGDIAVGTNCFYSMQVSGVAAATVSGFVIGSDGGYDPASSYNVNKNVAVGTPI